MENIEKWSTENKMYIKLILKGPKHYLSWEKGYNISFAWKQQAYNYTLNAKNINQILHQKLLGLIIDKDLSFEAYIDELCTRNCQNNLDF